MALNDVYQLRMDGTLFGQDTTNVFYYSELGGGGGNALDVAETFIADFIPVLRLLLTTSAVITRVQVINGNNNVDSSEQIVGLSGLDGIGSRLPAFIAAGFRSQRLGVTGQYAYKRFSGIGVYLDAAGTWSAAVTPNLISVGIALGSVLEGAFASYSPVLLTGGFSLGIAPVVAQVVDLPWSFNDVPTKQATRQSYTWVATG